MNKNNFKIISLLTVFVLESIPIPYSYAASLETRAYDYSNPIYQNGTNDTFIYDTNDSVITTKTGITRNIPQVTGKYDRSKYPIPLENKVPDKETFELIKAENKELMDNVETAIANGILTKHIAADGQFYGTIPDNVFGVEKKIYINTNAKGTHSLAVYVPAGEIATVKLSDEAMKYAKKGQLKISVGQTYTNADNYDHNHNEENRMPYLGKTFDITESETKVGTPFGGMLYLEVNHAVPSGLNLEVDVKGVVDAPYYDLGRTTKEEWKRAQAAPGLFTEIRTPYLRFMIPSKFIRGLEDIEDAVKFWNNATALSAHVMGQENRNQPMTLIFDPYISVGIAYASVGAWTCNLPPSWATGALDYESLMAFGSWGLIHEINHHYQSRYSGYRDEWGLGHDFSEITNNALNTISYILYSNIATSRTEYGTDDWNKVVDPYSSLKQQMYESVQYYPNQPNYGNFMYSSFAHEIGPLTLANVIKSTYDGATFNGIYIPPFDYKTESYQNVPFPNNERYDDFAYRLCIAAGRDYTWYMINELKWPLKDSTVANIKNLGYEEHIPVQSVYAMGELGRETGRPFTMPASGYTFDFDKSLVSPGKVTVIEISDPKYGTLTKRPDGKYDYQLNSSVPEDAREEFVLTVRVEADGVVQETQLNCTLTIDYNSISVEQFDITKWDIYDALEDVKVKQPYAITNSKGMRIDSDYGNKLARSKGYFTVEESGAYEFQVFGDDNTSFELHLEDGTTLQSLTQDYSSSVQMAYDQSTASHFTVQLEANKPYSYTLIANNKDGIGWADVNIRNTSANSSWQSITNVYGTLDDVGKKTNTTFIPPTPEFVRPHLLGGSDEVTLKDITVISNPIGVIPNNDPNSLKEGDPQNIVDGDITTYFHSSYTDGNRTPFPHEYIFDLGDVKTFNNLELYTRISGDTVGVIGNYEIYVTDELDGEHTNWKEIASDNNRYRNSSVPNDIKLTLPTTNARYIKVKALNNRDDYNLTILAEVKVSNKTKVNSLIAQDSSYIQYRGDWTKDVNGAFVNGGTYNSMDGSFTYAIDGSETNIYVANDVEVEISVDGVKWVKYKLKGDLREPSLTLNMDSSGQHTIEVRAIGQQIALNMLSTDGKFIKEDGPDRTKAPEITGIDNLEMGIGKVDSFNPLENVVVTDDYDTGLVPKVTGTIEKPKPGTNQTSTLTYTVTDKDGNTTTVDRLITVTNQLPTLTVNSIVIKENEAINLLTDSRLGLMAIDLEDEDLTSKIKVKELNGFNPDAPVIGAYEIIYSVEDLDKNTVETKVLVSVQSNQAPTIEGVEPITLKIGEVDSFDALANVIVIDDCDKDLKPVVTGTIEKPKPGTNQTSTLTYTVTDKDGNTTTVDRLITVTNQLPTLTANSIVIKENEAIDLLTDSRLGLMAIDLEDEDLTSKIKVKELNGFNPDAPVIGTYEIIYSVEDSDKNTIDLPIQIVVQSSASPIIEGITPLTLKVGEVDGFNPLDNIIVTDDKDTDLKATVTGTIVKPQPGTNEVSILTYKVTDSDGNTTTIERLVTVTNQLPTLTVNSIVIKENEAIDLLTDSRLGLMATDLEDEDLTSKIKVKELNGFNPDAPIVGEYQVTYLVEDTDGNVTEKTILIKVESNNVPIISGIENITLTSGEAFNPLDGVSAFDKEDGDLTDIKVIGTINPYQIGEQQLIYQVTDSDGNVVTGNRVVTVTYQVETPTDPTVSKVIIPHTELQLKQLVDDIKTYDSQAILVETREEAEYYLYKIKIISMQETYSVQSEYLIELKVSKQIQPEAGLPGFTPDNNNNSGEQPGIMPDDNNSGEQPGIMPDDNNSGEKPGTTPDDNNSGEKPGINNSENINTQSSKPVTGYTNLIGYVGSSLIALGSLLSLKKKKS